MLEENKRLKIKNKRSRNATFDSVGSMFSQKKRRGSALIFTLMIIALVASLSFYISRGAVREQRIATASQQSLGAYYAAEAGIEDGLARLAADKNIEVPTCGFGEWHGKTTGAVANSTPCDVSDLVSDATPLEPNYNTNLSIETIDKPKEDPLYAFPSRVRIARFGANGARTSNSTSNSVLNKTVQAIGSSEVKPTNNATDYFYDLKITSKANHFGDVDAVTGNPTSPGQALKDGNVREFNVESGVGNPEAPELLKVYWSCDGALSCPPDSRLVITLIYSQGGGASETTVDKLLPPTTAYDPSYEVTAINRALTDLIRIRIKPLGSDIHLSTVMLNSAGVAVKTRSDIARLQSIGYFGGVTRRLEATIDRNSGSILGLFDYAVYAGSSLTAP